MTTAPNQVDPASKYASPQELAGDARVHLLDEEIGAPPDAFNTQGQKWGVTTFSPAGIAGSRCWVLIVGGTIPSRMLSRQAIPSMAPAAPSRCPVIDLVELTGIL